MGGFRSFFLESKFFQLVVEEGGRFFSLRIFERSRYFMKLVFMGKNGAQWLMKSIEQIVVGISLKNFYTFREGDLAYTLQCSSNSFGMFLLLTEFKVSGSRRSIFIPEGRVKNGWRVFGYVARVRFGIRVRVRVQVRDSAIFEKGGCGCGRTRRLKNY